MADTKLTDLPTMTRTNPTYNPPSAEDWAYVVDRHVTTDSVAGSSRKASLQELGFGLAKALNQVEAPGGRLTLSSATPVTTGDVTGTTLYYTPYIHDCIALYDVDSRRFEQFRFTEKALPLGTLTANKNYDVFAYYGGDPAVRATSSGSLTASSAVTLPTRVAGDLLVVILTCSGATSPAANTGWTRRVTAPDPTNTVTVAIYTKVSDGTDATGPLAATTTGVYEVTSVTNGTWAEVNTSSQAAGAATAAQMGNPENVNPFGVTLGAWAIASSTATITPTGYAAAVMTTPIGTQTFPSGTGRMLMGHRTLAGSYNGNGYVANLSASVASVVAAISIVGGVKLELGLAWATDTARPAGAPTYGTGVGGINGRLTGSSTTSGAIYLGTIRSINTTQTTDSQAKRFVWNMYNRVMKVAFVSGGTVHTYGTAAFRAWNNDPTLRTEWVTGALGDFITVNLHAQLNNLAIVSVGFGTTTAGSLTAFIYNGNASSFAAGYSEISAVGVGYQYAQLVEFANGGAANFEGARVSISIMM